MFVGEHDDLHPVAQRQLAQDGAHMGLTVGSLANTVPAISALDRPRATAVNTSRSLSLSPRLGDVLGTPPPAGDPTPSGPNPSGDPSRADDAGPAC